MVAFSVGVELLRIAERRFLRHRSVRRDTGAPGPSDTSRQRYGDGQTGNCHESVRPRGRRYAERPTGIKPVMNHNHPFRRLGALTVIAAALVSFATGCSDDPETPAGNAAAAAAGGPEPKTLDGAKAAAQTMFDRFSGGDFAGAWEMYTAKGKQAITKADYVKLNEACSRKGLAIQLTSARMEGADRAVVIAKQLVAAQSYTMVYESDAWKLEPAKEGLALYAKGAAKAIAAKKKAGTCVNA